MIQSRIQGEWLNTVSYNVLSSANAGSEPIEKINGKIGIRDLLCVLGYCQGSCAVTSFSIESDINTREHCQFVIEISFVAQCIACWNA